MNDTVTGDVTPSDDGRWLGLKEAAAHLGINERAVYMQARRGTRARKRDERGRVLVWVTGEVTTLPADEEQRALDLPARDDMLPVLLQQATAPLVARIEEVVRENERLRHALEQVTASRNSAEVRAAGLAADLEQERSRRPWWRFWW